MNKPFLDLIKPLLDNGVYSIRRDGRLRRMVMGFRADSMWLHANSGHPDNPTQGDCYLWNDVFWDVIAKKKAVHSNCAGRRLEEGCFKVVLRPRTLVELMVTYDYQQSNEWPCKCGVETRGDAWNSSLYLPVEHHAINALYGAYWYNKGLDMAKARFAEVKLWAEETFPKLEYRYCSGREIPQSEQPISVIIKKGCTEFERSVGPSDKWHTQIDAELEKMVSDNIVWQPMDLTQPQIVVQQTLVRWIEWAYGHGDKTYKEFSQGMDIYPGYVTYHDQPTPLNDNVRTKPKEGLDPLAPNNADY